MSRPVGSKNKPKETIPWQALKESKLPNVHSVENPLPSERKRKTRSITITPSETVDTSCGKECVETAGSRVVKGFINIMKNSHNPRRVGYYTGGDIHPTEEHAKRVATKDTIATIFIAFET